MKQVDTLKKTLEVALQNAVANEPKKQKETEANLGTSNIYYGLTMGVLRSIAKEFYVEHKELSYVEFIGLLDRLYTSDVYEEKVVASLLLSSYGGHRKNLDLGKLEGWLEHLSGWAEIDNLCQSMFPEEEVLPKWSSWEPLLRKFSKSDNISKRRASLVLLLKSFRTSDDIRLQRFNLETIDLLRYEKDILITKAVSWSLRTMIKHHRDAVTNYLSANEKSLPAIAVRETKKKLATGTK